MLKRIAKRIPFLIITYRLLLALRFDYGFNFIRFIKDILWYYNDYKLYKRLSTEESLPYRLSRDLLYPCMRDKTKHTPIEYTYFYQDTWAARKIRELAPAQHFDVGSSVKSMAMISQFVPVTMIDIRPIDVALDGFSFKEGNILALPFDNAVIESLSSLCVVEHIGLGRYGDAIDPAGSEKAASELSRVLISGGHLFFSVPVDSENRIYFNAHRAFTRSRVLEIFPDLDLFEETYIYGSHMCDEYDPTKGFGTGLFHFIKR